MNKIKLSHAVILFALITIVLASCLKNDNDTPYVDNLEFTIRVPVDWQYESDIDDSVRYYAISPIRPNDVTQGSDSVREDLIITSEYYPFSTLEDLYLNSLTYYKTTLDNYDSLSTENILINGNDCIKHIHLQSISVPSLADPEVDVEIELKMIRYFILRNEYSYIITCGAQPSTFDHYSPIFETIVGSFEFKE